MVTYFSGLALFQFMENIEYCAPGHLFCRAKKVMLAVDGSEGASRAANVAFEVAEMTGSTVYIVHVIPMPTVAQFALMSGSDLEEVKQKYIENGNKLLEGYKSAAIENGIECEMLLEEGLPSGRIIYQSKNLEVDIVVMGSKGATSGARTGMGSTVERVMEGGEVTVLVVK
ncbi:MAG: universal stress protein [Candidatus Thorarchaeota archaeon]|jgi:nucleotide-binding universal stress UspA family protein